MPSVPTMRKEPPARCPDQSSNNRDSVERPWVQLKELPAFATGYQGAALKFTSVVCLAASCDWIR